MRNFLIIVALATLFGLTGCAPRIPKPLPSNSQSIAKLDKAFVLTSQQHYTVTCQAESSEPFHKDHLIFLLSIYNPDAAPLHFSPENISVVSNGENLKILDAQELLQDTEQWKETTIRKAKLREVRLTRIYQDQYINTPGAQIGDYDDYDPVEAELRITIAQDAAKKRIARAEETAKSRVAAIERFTIRPTAIEPKTWYRGQVEVQLAHPIERGEVVAVTTTLPNDRHECVFRG